MDVEGLIVNALNIKTGDFYSVHEKTPFVFKMFRRLMLIPKLRVIFFILLKPFLLREFFKYDIADLQFINSTYDKLIPLLRKKGLAVKASFVGSDFYRASKERIKKLHLILHDVDMIFVGTEDYKKDFLKEFPETSDKIEVSHIGLNQLEDLKVLMENKPLKSNPLFPNKGDKIFIACGYNGSKGQRHLKIIEAVNKLGKETKDKIFLIFPMTYGTPEGYIQSLNNVLENSGIDYKIFDKRLSFEELMYLRIASDIVINIQVTDAFAGSIQEHIMTGGVMILGEWLPYSILDKNGIFTIKTSVEGLSNNIQKVVDNFEYYKDKSSYNTEKIYRLSSWKYVRKKRADIYKFLLR